MSKEQPIILNMIVKNEAKVIRRCLESVKPYIDAYVIHDGYSTDGTLDIIHEVMGDMPGSAFPHKADGLTHARNKALLDATAKALPNGYILFMDADDTMTGPPFPVLSKDAYVIMKKLGKLEYVFHALIKADARWRYEGVIHEYIYLPRDVPYTQDVLPENFIVSFGDGSRGTDPKKYLKIAVEGERGLVDTPDDARLVFYTAQSWQHAGDPERAKMRYEQRVQMGPQTFPEEHWYALYMLAMISPQLKETVERTVGRFLVAYEHRPWRAETLVHLAEFLASVKLENLAVVFRARAAAMPWPKNDILFLEPDCYSTRAPVRTF